MEGLEHLPRSGPVIVIGNHLSYLDPLAHGYFVVRAGRYPRFLAKAELFRNPLLRTVLHGMRQIPVHRGSGDQAPLEEAARALGRGEVLVIYPEGTSTASGPGFTPGRGKTGAVRLALATGARIVPVATWGGQYVWRRGSFRFPEFGRPIWLRAAEPIDVRARAAGAPDDYETLRRLTDELMAELAELVAGLRESYPRRWARAIG
jgi:1-acyl-sn-glycerol-3-phosphate acyltransferase